MLHKRWIQLCKKYNALVEEKKFNPNYFLKEIKLSKVKDSIYIQTQELLDRLDDRLLYYIEIGNMDSVNLVLDKIKDIETIMDCLLHNDRIEFYVYENAWVSKFLFIPIKDKYNSKIVVGTSGTGKTCRIIKPNDILLQNNFIHTSKLEATGNGKMVQHTEHEE